MGYRLDSDAVGYTLSESYYQGYYLYGKYVKLQFKITKATICILAYSGQTIDECKNVCTHELGHAIGFFGHSGNATEVMYPYVNSIYTLQTAEKNHLLQVYK